MSVANTKNTVMFEIRYNTTGYNVNFVYLNKKPSSLVAHAYYLYK